MPKDYNPQPGRELCTTVPMIEYTGAEYAEGLESPRLLKTHFNYVDCPKSSEAKYIYATRNPKDCLTSYFFHIRNFKLFEWADGDFDVFFELFCSGEIEFGSYFDHLLSWLPHVGDENVLLLKYEDMCADLESAVHTIGKFIGGSAAQLVDDADVLRRVVAESRIESMRENQDRWFPESAMRTESFVRKGGSRDWKNYFSREQSDRLDALFRLKLADTAAANWWTSEMRWDDSTG